jgi:hypothetical protein
LETAFKYCKECRQEFQQQVLTALFEMQRCTDVEWNKEERDGLVNWICKAIDDNSLLLNGNDKLVQADDCITRLALISWIKSPMQYEREKATSIDVYPSQRTLYREFKKIRHNEGIFPKAYGMFRDRLLELEVTGTLHGQIMYDEMKLKSFSSSVPSLRWL